MLVTGATGRVGGQVLAALSDTGAAVRAFARDPRGLPGGVAGDLSHPDTLVPALAGVDRVFLVWPGIPVEPRVVELIAEHARQVVYLSADVPDLADGEPPSSFHQEIERQLRGTGLDWTFLRAIDFAANTLAWAPQIRRGVVELPYGQASRSLLHERDIAEVAAHVLTTTGHHGGKYVLTGPESVPQAELVRTIGEVVGREVRWRELAPEIALERFTEIWGDRAFAEARLAAWRSFVEIPERVTGTVARLLGKPARTFRTWATEHAAAFR
ncbi:nucleoside-diphosphate sugar epimerase [Amycolatopsis albispora]|uniref:Nucleoside-diphosphate sugar epimerase n=1 Tax=Amycolatopsis albispora TaxID=1804986 RepID=A0A344LK51_9PSEU|nr:nucleoside-diphosphate sugar epimerase [Amycolatopsis albispora]